MVLFCVRGLTILFSKLNPCVLFFSHSGWSWDHSTQVSATLSLFRTGHHISFDLSNCFSVFKPRISLFFRHPKSTFWVVAADVFVKLARVTLIRNLAIRSLHIMKGHHIPFHYPTKLSHVFRPRHGFFFYTDKTFVLCLELNGKGFMVAEAS